MSLRVASSLLLLSLLSVVREAAAEPVVFVVDARPGNGSAVGTGGNLGILGAVVGNTAQRSVDRKAAEIAAEFYPALSFDVLDAFVASVPVPAQIGAGAGDLISALPEEQWHGRSGWTPAAMSHFEDEVRTSFADLAAMWARIAADADGVGNPQPAWEKLPAVPKEQGDWVFHCTAMANCKGERLVKLTAERAWISAPPSVGIVLASLDHKEAAQAPNFIWIPISSGAP